MTLQVVSDAPLPADAIRKGPTPIYPFRSMKPGEAFFVPATGGENMRDVVARAHWAVQNHRRKGHKDQKFTVRRMEDRVAVWRVL